MDKPYHVTIKKILKIQYYPINLGILLDIVDFEDIISAGTIAISRIEKEGIFIYFLML